MSEDLDRRIADGLANYRDRNEIIQMVCEQAGVNWARAEQLVKQVELERAHTIARKQSPLLILLSTVTMLAGIGVVYYSVSTLLQIFHGDLLMIVLGLGIAYTPLTLGVFGLAMFAGGLIGLNTTYRRYFET